MKKITILLAILFVHANSPAYAYLDPGATSIILQWLVGGIAVGATAISVFYQRIKFFFLKLMKIK